MEEKEIRDYIRRFSRLWGLDKHPTCLICGADINENDAGKVEAAKSREGLLLVHKECYKKEQKQWTTRK